jgi:hypothetical protein
MRTAVSTMHGIEQKKQVGKGTLHHRTTDTLKAALKNTC